MPANVKKFLVLYDDLCVLCTWSVFFIMRNDTKSCFYFASLKSKDLPEDLRSKIELKEGENESVVFYDGDKIFRYSSAALGIAGQLRFPWNVLKIFLIIPKFIRDFIYKWIANNRYRIFGKLEVCRIAPDEEKWRFDYKKYYKK